MSGEESSSIVYQYSVKIEQTAKGARVTAHAYNNNMIAVKSEAVELYVTTIEELKQRGQVVAPIEQGKSASTT